MTISLLTMASRHPVKANKSHQTRPSKMRMSCNTCQKSKVKCGQEKPACERCLSHDFDCSYSPSKRAGRPRPGKEARNQESNHGPDPSLDTCLPVEAQPRSESAEWQSCLYKSPFGHGDPSNIFEKTTEYSETYINARSEQSPLEIPQTQTYNQLGEQHLLDDCYEVCISPSSPAR